MTVQELKDYLEHLANDREVKLIGGQMNTICAINQIATNFNEPMNQKGGVVQLVLGGSKLPEPPLLPPALRPQSKSIVARILDSLVGDNY